MIQATCPQMTCFEEYYEHLLTKGSFCQEVELVILSLMFRVSLQVLFIDQAQTIKSFKLQYPASAQAMTLSVIEGVFDVCYNKAFIQKAAYCQKIVRCLVETAMDS